MVSFDVRFAASSLAKLSEMKQLTHRNTGCAPVRRCREMPFAAEHFDRLADGACIDMTALRAITGKSRATIYNWLARGILPQPRKLGRTHNVWSVGEIRQALTGTSSEGAGQ